MGFTMPRNFKMAKKKEQAEEVIEIVETSTSEESSLDLESFVEKNKKNSREDYSASDFRK